MGGERVPGACAYEGVTQLHPHVWMGRDGEVLVGGSAVDSAYFDASLRRDQCARGEVPRVEPVLVVGIEVAGSDEAQVEGRRAKAAVGVLLSRISVSLCWTSG